MDISLNTNIATDISNAVIQIINNLCEKFGIVFDWTAENVWPTLQALSGKFVKMIIVSNWIEIILCILVSIGIVKATMYFRDQDWEALMIIGCIISAGFIAFTISAIFIDTLDLIRCYTFPEFAMYKHIVAELESIM